MKPETNTNCEWTNKNCEGEHQKIKQGHWVELVFMLMCSECGWFVLRFENYKFCPHCGARMENGREYDECIDDQELTRQLGRLKMRCKNEQEKED